MKKKVLLASLLVMILLVCGACSDAMGSYLDTLEKVNSLEEIVGEGTITLSIKDEDLSALLEEDGLDPDLLEDITLTYTAKQNNTAMLAVLEAELAMGKDIQLPFTMYVDSMHVYLEVADYMAILEEFGDETEVAEFRAFFGDAQWVDILALSEADMELINYDETEEAMQQLVDEVFNFMNAIGKAYADFDTDIFTAAGNTYTLKLDNQSTAELLNTFMEYTVENADAIAAALTEYFNESTMFEEAEKAEMIQGLEEFAAEMAVVTPEELEASAAEMDVVFANLGVDYDIDYKLTRGNNSTYTETMELSFAYETEEGDDAEIVLTVEDTIKAAKNLDIQLPTEGIATLEELVAAGRETAKPNKISATIYLDDNYMYYTKGYVVPFLDDYGQIEPDYKLIDNYTYLPLRAIAEACGEEVGWDSEKKQAYVVINEENIYMESYADTEIGRTYIKIRDFEQLGYTADYVKDEYLGGIVTLTK